MLSFAKGIEIRAWHTKMLNTKKYVRTLWFAACLAIGGSLELGPAILKKFEEKKIKRVLFPAKSI